MDYHYINGRYYYKIGQVRELLDMDNKTIQRLIKFKRLTFFQERPYADRLFYKNQVDRIKEILDSR